MQTAQASLVNQTLESPMGETRKDPRTLDSHQTKPEIMYPLKMTCVPAYSRKIP